MAARANEGALSEPVENKETTLKKKKSSWFRRNPEEKERQQSLQHKPSTGRLDIPEAWQGLDDRLDKGARANSTANGIVQNPSRQSHRSDSSEFPARHCVTQRKSFLGLFGKKQKDEKSRYPNVLEIQCKCKSRSYSVEVLT
jgi:hypothetical protein